MAKRPSDDQTESEAPVSTPQLDRLQKLANVAAAASQERQWRARKNGLQAEDEPSEVRSLNHDAEARAQAEEAMKKMMAQSKGKPRRR